MTTDDKPVAQHMLVPAIIRTSDHRYIYEGQEYPGTTGILKVLDKSDALMAWAARQTATAAVRLYGENIAEGRNAFDALMLSVGPEGTIRALGERSRWQRDEAAQLGSAVHKLAETRQYDHADEGVAKRAKAYADWWDASGWTRPMVEVIGVNPSVGYGGTADLIARDADGRLTLADIKTGKGVYREAILQLAAYGDFTLILLPDGRTAVMPIIERYVILHVTLDGVREIDLSVGQDERMAFLDCVDLYRWTKKVKGML